MDHVHTTEHTLEERATPGETPIRTSRNVNPTPYNTPTTAHREQRPTTRHPTTIDINVPILSDDEEEEEHARLQQPPTPTTPPGPREQAQSPYNPYYPTTPTRKRQQSTPQRRSTTPPPVPIYHPTNHYEYAYIFTLTKPLPPQEQLHCRRIFQSIPALSTDYDNSCIIPANQNAMIAYHEDTLRNTGENRDHRHIHAVLDYLETGIERYTDQYAHTHGHRERRDPLYPTNSSLDDTTGAYPATPPSAPPPTYINVIHDQRNYSSNHNSSTHGYHNERRESNHQTTSDHDYYGRSHSTTRKEDEKMKEHTSWTPTQQQTASPYRIYSPTRFRSPMKEASPSQHRPPQLLSTRTRAQARYSPYQHSPTRKHLHNGRLEYAEATARASADSHHTRPININEYGSFTEKHATEEKSITESAQPTPSHQ